MTTNDILKDLVGNGNKTHFAKKHNTSRSALAMWLNGSRKIKFSTLEKIATNEGHRLLTDIKLEKL